MSSGPDSALEQFGYTPRQARFLLLVALHGGYFLSRQYLAFIGGVYGKATFQFVATAIARGDVRALPYGRQGRVFHLHAREVYAAIGQERNTNRRSAEWPEAIRKLMTLDFVLAERQARFWATEEEKVALLTELGVHQDAWPARRHGPRRRAGPATFRYFVDRMPWFREPDDPRLWFTYVDAEHTLQGFETFLGQYKDLLAALPSAVTYVGRGTWPRAVEQTFRKVTGIGSSGHSVSVPQFLDHCRTRREIETGCFERLSVADIARFRDGRPQFANSVFDDLYTRWLRDGDGAMSTAEPSATRATYTSTLRVHMLTFNYGQARRRR
jgi:hypothetical protein